MEASSSPEASSMADELPRSGGDGESRERKRERERDLELREKERKWSSLIWRPGSLSWLGEGVGQGAHWSLVRGQMVWWILHQGPS